MGCIISWCNERKKIMKDLEYKVRVLNEELKGTRNQNVILRTSLSNASKECMCHMKIIDDYKNVLFAESDKTADIIMSGKLHLKYMDDFTEKKHICDVLKASFELVNN